LSGEFWHRGILALLSGGDSWASDPQDRKMSPEFLEVAIGSH
jgi:hypothetical protein